MRRARWRQTSTVVAAALGVAVVAAGCGWCADCDCDVPVADEGAVVALDAATGAERWRAAVGWVERTRPVVGAGFVYVGTREGAERGDPGAVVALDAATGQERWRRAFRAAPTPLRPPTDGRLVVRTEDGRERVLDAATGAVLPVAGDQRLPPPNEPLLGHGDPVPEDSPDVDLAIAADASAPLVARDPATGQERWRAALPYGISGAAVADGVVFVASAESQLGCG